jgi:hypothetical protein
MQMLSLEFTTAVNPDTITSSSVYIKDSNNNPVGAQLIRYLDNKKIIIKPYQYLKPSSEYTFVATTTLKSASGQSLSQPYTYTFKTKNDSTDDGLPVSFADIKPSDSVLVSQNSDISIQFNKDIAPIANPDGLIIVKDGDGVGVNGTIEFFNSIVTFKPDTALQGIEMTYTVTLDGSRITDMYGNSYDETNATTWTFSTISNESEGYKSLANIDLLSNSNKQILTAYPSMLVVANGTTLDVVKINTNLTKITLEKIQSYNMNTTIYSAYNLDDLLFIATQNNINILRVGQDGSISVEQSPVSVVGKIYDFIVDNNKIYAVGPEFGFKVYGEDGTIFKEIDTTQMVPIDIEISKGVNGQIRLHLSDYNGKVHHYDENATFISATDLNGSTRDMAIIDDASSEDTALFVSNSLGKQNVLDLNGTINPDFLVNDFELLSSADGIISKAGVLYINNRQKGIVVYDDYEQSIYGPIQTSGEIVDFEIIDLMSNYPLIVTVDAAGSLNVFNAYQDTESPTISANYNSSEDNFFLNTEALDFDTLSIDNFSLEDNTLNASVLDFDTLSIDNSSLEDNTSSAVDFNLSATLSPTWNQTQIIITTSPGACILGCTLSISPNVKDIVGNSYVGGNKPLQEGQ